MLRRLLVEMLECLGGVAALVRTSVDTEIFSAADDRDLKGGFDLPDVFIERAAQIGEPFVIDWGE